MDGGRPPGRSTEHAEGLAAECSRQRGNNSKLEPPQQNTLPERIKADVRLLEEK
jgi:hypothetical protein